MRLISAIFATLLIPAESFGEDLAKVPSDDWTKPIDWLVSSPFVRWAQLGTGPKKFSDKPIWIAGFLSVERRGEELVFRLFDNPASLEYGRTSESCSVTASELLAKGSDPKFEWEKLNGHYVEMQGRFVANPAWTGGEEYGRFSRPIFMRLKDRGGKSIEVVRELPNKAE